MDKEKKERRDRLVVLGCVSVLLLLVYGPAADWFVAADRILYDQIAGHVDNEPLENGVIVSINPAKKEPGELADLYGRLVGRF
ncbi:MAG: hypothetical protein ACREQ1_14330, partial [Woeseiaceae bacterium]